MDRKELLNLLDVPASDRLFEPLYQDKSADNRMRYTALLSALCNWEEAQPPVASADVRLFTAAGRTELCGNHTDHNQGKVVAASVQLDIAAVVAKRNDKKVFFRSTGFPDVIVDIGNLQTTSAEHGTTAALVRGIAAEFSKRGVPVSGWTAVADSIVPPGSGLSSSAAIEGLFGCIFNNLYNGNLTAAEIARIGQIAENTYFGKPCGLMDQMACASGAAVMIDFADLEKPKTTRIPFDPASCGYVLTVVNTRGSHEGLTPDYAAIPAEMKELAAFFGKAVLSQTKLTEIIAQAKEIRKKCGDRALLRAIHFHNENKRVENLHIIMGEIAAGKRERFADFLDVIKESGRSSWELLQNVYSPSSPQVQGVSAALALSENFLAGSGAVRVHGGGFAGTIQAYIPQDRLNAYLELMDGVFGKGALTPLRIREVGIGEVI